MAAAPGLEGSRIDGLAASGERAASGGFYIPSLDGIRALAFLVVFIAHAGLGDVVPGGFGVTVFFFLSGYLITTLLRREYDRGADVDLRSFYVRRTLRIFPPYYAVLLVAVLTARPWEIDPGMLWSQLLYVSNFAIAHQGSYDGLAAGTGVYWSLAVEEHFYLFFPLLYLAVRRRTSSPRRQVLVLAGLCTLVLAWRCVLVYGFGAPELRTYLATDARMDSILFGCILALRGNPMMDPPSAGERTFLKVGVPLSLAVLAFTFLYRDAAFRETFRYTLQGLALFPLFILAIRHHRLPGIRLLNVGWVRYLGVLSYGMYLVHHTILERLSGWGAPAVATGLVALALSVAAAVAVRDMVEKPSAALRRRVLARVRTAPAVQT